MNFTNLKLEICTNTSTKFLIIFLHSLFVNVYYVGTSISKYEGLVGSEASRKSLNVIVVSRQIVGRLFFALHTDLPKISKRPSK